ICVGCKWKAKTDSSVKRLIEISRSLEALKTSSLPITQDLFIFGFALLPRRMTRFLFTKMVLSGGTVFASSFPVSNQYFYLDDLKIAKSFTSSGTLGDKIGITILATGTAGRTRLVVNIDKRLLPSNDLQQRLGLYIKEEIDQYLQLDM
ncbi:unnamed protein product, partial [Allacma fusca]